MFNYYLMRFIVANNSSSVNGSWIRNADRDVAYKSAIADYYAMVALAASSNNPTDTVILLDYNGVPIKMQRFNHE